MLHYVSRSNTLHSLTIVVTKGTIASARMVMLGNDKLEGHLIQLCPEVTKATRTPPTDTQRTKRLERFSLQISHVIVPKNIAVHSEIFTIFSLNLNPKILQCTPKLKHFSYVFVQTIKISQSTPKYFPFFVINLYPKISQSTPKYLPFFVINLNQKISECTPKFTHISHVILPKNIAVHSEIFTIFS
jgi:hypothetical protein